MKRLLTGSLTLASVITLSGCPAHIVKEGIQQIPNATQAQCATERDILDKAVQAYTLLEGKPPTSEKLLVPDYLHELSRYYGLDAKGNVIPLPGRGCV